MEISLVQRGAVRQAFAFLTDNKNNPSVEGLEKSAIFSLDRLSHGVRNLNTALARIHRMTL
jgi:hypothetical protein